MPLRDVVEMNLDNLRHAMIRASGQDLIVLFVAADLTVHQMDHLEQFADAVSEETDATLAIFPHDVVSGCCNYSLRDLLSLRAIVEDLITERVTHYPNIEA